MAINISRREALTAGSFAVLLGSAGCLDETNDSEDPEDDEDADESDEVDDNWTMHQGDLANTGYTPTTGPTSEVTIQWQYDAADVIQTSPAVVDGTVYFGDDAGFIYALDASTGDEIWTYTDDGYSYDVLMKGTPTVRDGTVYMTGEGDFASNGFTYAVDAADGDERWKYRTWEVYGSVAVADDMVYVPTNYDAFVALREHVEFDVESGDLDRWEDIDEDDIEALNDHDDWGDLEELENIDETDLLDLRAELDTEKYVSHLWTFDSDYSDTPTFHGNTAVGADLVITSSTEGNTYALDRETGDEVWSVPIRSKGPAIADGTVYVGHDTLYALDLESGDEQWTYSDSLTNTSPAIADGTLYIGNSIRDDEHRNHLTAIDASTGDPEWQTPLEKRPREPPVVTDEAVYVTDSESAYDPDDALGRVTALDRDTGDELWSYEFETYIYPTPVVSNGTVYIGTKDGTFYALEET